MGAGHHSQWPDQSVEGIKRDGVVVGVGGVGVAAVVSIFYVLIVETTEIFFFKFLLDYLLHDELIQVFLEVKKFT